MRQCSIELSLDIVIQSRGSLKNFQFCKKRVPMCDCYWPTCERCSTSIPLHIADFCMPRENISVFCADHLPRRNVVVYEIVGESFQPGLDLGNDFYREPPKGWRMGVRYKRRPPTGYGLQAAEPNVGTDYLAEYRTKNGGHYYFTTYGDTRCRTEHAAIQNALRNIEQRRARCVDGRPSYDDGFFRTLRRKAHRYSVTPVTREMWMKSSARWLSTAIYQYFHPDCPHCFFGALYHAGRDLLRAHLIAHGGDLVEGWEIETAIGERWPDLAEAFGRIRWARAHWQSYAFPQFENRLQIEGALGELLLSLESIDRSVYRSYRLRLPIFQTFFGEFIHRRGARRFFSIDIQPDQETIFLGYENGAGKLKLARRKIPRRSNNARSRE